jgi:hypothetical protein
MSHQGVIGQELFSALEAGASPEELEELLYSHLPSAFGDPSGFCAD